VLYVGADSTLRRPEAAPVMIGLVCGRATLAAAIASTAAATMRGKADETILQDVQKKFLNFLLFFW